ncbi:hypothetical protein ACN28G_11430 [Micromonospora sp. WMMA1923]|uniref:hypothetical protein n=1 Tax=Micromonospora sp. WMMA1923 TaxID=3404125 RepID=UPI003B93415F
MSVLTPALLLSATALATTALGLPTARRLPRPWRTTVTAGTLGSALLLLTTPLTGTPGRTTTTLLPIGLLWWFLLASAVCHTARDRRRGRPGPPPPPR